MKLKLNLILSLLFFFLLSEKIFGQERMERYSTFTSIDADEIFYNFSHFKCLDICSDTIFVTELGKNSKSYVYSTGEFKEWLYRNYYSSSWYFQMSSVVNNGYCIIIDQYLKSSPVPIRFFTLFLSKQNGKIVIVEVEENANVNQK